MDQWLFPIAASSLDSIALRNLELTNVSVSSQSKLLLELMRVWPSVGEQGSSSNPAFLRMVQITGDSNAASQTG
jgi:hypothetical protein